MTLSLPWRTVLATLLVAGVPLAGCNTTATDELSGQSAEKLYADAKEEMASGGYEKAIKALERVEGLAAGSLLSQQAQLDLAYAYWKSGERAQALSTIERFIKLNPSSPALDYGLYLRGVINFSEDLGFLGNLAGQDISERDQRASRDSYQAFKQLVEQFPASKYSADARLRMDYIVNSLAANEVHVARYYLNRGAYVAAANRAQQAVTDFPRAPAVEEALYIMMQSYANLELPKLHDDAARVLGLNFPDSRFLGGQGTASQKSWWQLW